MATNRTTVDDARSRPSPGRPESFAAKPARAKRWFFDAWSVFYDLPFVQRLTYRPVHEAVLRLLRRHEPCELLDLGCGTGLLTRRICRAHPNASVVGCDFSHGMLRRAAEHGHQAVWVQGDATRLPFGDARFDTIASTEAFHWFPDQRAALDECFRVLAPRGRLLVALVNPPVEAMSSAMYLGSRLVGQPFYWPTRERMRELVESVGFRVEEQQRLYRVPAGFLLPPVLTVAVRP
jgi:ubiquinone/menaquinone biosynthesis C-methylase UbiE